MLTAHCIYTILHSKKLKNALAKGGIGEYEEQKRWVQGRRLLERAKQDGERLPVIFAPAEQTDPLYGWAILDNIIVKNGKTKYSFSGLRPFKESGHKFKLRKKRNGEPLSRGFIRPYAICITPEYLREA